MSDALYKVVFRGKIIEGHDAELVRQNVAKLLKLPPEQIDTIFSGKTVVLKKDADEATAQKYDIALKKAGALIEIVPMTAPTAIVPPEKPATAAPKMTTSEPLITPVTHVAPPQQEPAPVSAKSEPTNPPDNDAPQDITASIIATTPASLPNEKPASSPKKSIAVRRPKSPDQEDAAEPICPRCGKKNFAGAYRCSLCNGLLIEEDYATLPQRIGSALVDWALVLLVYLVALPFLARNQSVALLIAVAIALPWVYFCLLEMSAGQATYGKKLLGLAVTDHVGDRLSLLQGSIRFIFKLLTGLMGGVGLFAAAYDRKMQGLHDRLAKSFVVQRGPANWWQLLLIFGFLVGMNLIFSARVGTEVWQEIARTLRVSKSLSTGVYAYKEPSLQNAFTYSPDGLAGSWYLLSKTEATTNLPDSITLTIAGEQLKCDPDGSPYGGQYDIRGASLVSAQGELSIYDLKFTLHGKEEGIVMVRFAGGRSAPSTAKKSQYIDLTGRWMLYNTTGMSAELSLTMTGRDQYHFTPEEVAYAGIYFFNGRELRMLQSYSPEDDGLRWQIKNLRLQSAAVPEAVYELQRTMIKPTVVPKIRAREHSPELPTPMETAVLNLNPSRSAKQLNGRWEVTLAQNPQHFIVLIEDAANGQIRLTSEGNLEALPKIAGQLGGTYEMKGDILAQQNAVGGAKFLWQIKEANVLLELISTEHVGATLKKQAESNGVMESKPRFYKPL